jgi:magnesium and cobalt transporter
MESDSSHKPSLLERISHWLMREPEDREQLIELLHGAYENNLMDADALAMIEGVLQVSEMRVGEIMIPRAQMDVIDINDAPEKFIPFVIETAHSRFPVIDKDQDDVIGFIGEGSAAALRRIRQRHPRHAAPGRVHPRIEAAQRAAEGIRSNRNHIAIVVDEYGGVAGSSPSRTYSARSSATSRTNTTSTRPRTTSSASTKACSASAGTEIEDFNQTLGAHFSDEEFDTVGGLIVSRFGHLPKRGETVKFDGFQFSVLRADSRRLHAVRVTRLPSEEDAQLPLV